LGKSDRNWNGRPVAAVGDAGIGVGAYLVVDWEEHPHRDQAGKDQAIVKGGDPHGLKA